MGLLLKILSSRKSLNSTPVIHVFDRCLRDATTTVFFLDSVSLPIPDDLPMFVSLCVLLKSSFLAIVGRDYEIRCGMVTQRVSFVQTNASVKMASICSILDCSVFLCAPRLQIIFSKSTEPGKSLDQFAIKESPPACAIARKGNYLERKRRYEMHGLSWSISCCDTQTSMQLFTWNAPSFYDDSPFSQDFVSTFMALPTAAYWFQRIQHLSFASCYDVFKKLFLLML